MKKRKMVGILAITALLCANTGVSAFAFDFTQELSAEDMQTVFSQVETLAENDTDTTASDGVTSTQSVAVTATMKATVATSVAPTYSVTIPSNIDLEGISYEEGANVAYEIVVSDIAEGEVTIASPDIFELADDLGNTFFVTNTFGSQTVTNEETIIAYLQVDPSELIDLPEGDYCGNTTFCIEMNATN